ncbi:hypothetical protein DICVIV_13301 [Dictyocaulus viviparus]|uniref:Receptor ligand binding region domain-containing protein n=1 Tax=Dictyocaulus viviparus TaxID=29172 RepID=A0A0D8XAS9_DICVI|nr:hypothetical protein DICVIV_13301 [Dictyocaulus viviparus]
MRAQMVGCPRFIYEKEITALFSLIRLFISFIFVQDPNASSYAGQLYNGLYAYARALNLTLQRDPSAFRNGTQILENIAMTFEGQII